MRRTGGEDLCTVEMVVVGLYLACLCVRVAVYFTEGRAIDEIMTKETW